MDRRRRGSRPEARPALRLHEGFVGARTLIGTRYLASAERREEYEQEIAPRTEEALARILARVFGSSPTEACDLSPPRRCLDLGAGTGAATRAVKAFFSRYDGREVEVVGVDRVPADGLVVADLSRADALPWLGGRFDLLVEAHLLNELFAKDDLGEDERAHAIAPLVERWVADHLQPQGLVVLLEPALRETSRLLLAVRDVLLAKGNLEVIAPCLTNAPCPARTKPRDWCHDAVPATRGDAMRVDFSYLVLRPRGTPERVSNEPDHERFRVVSDLLSEKGRLRLYGCGPAGRVPLIRLDKHRSETNAAFDDLARGDRVRVGPTDEAQDGRRILPASSVRPERG